MLNFVSFFSLFYLEILTSTAYSDTAKHPPPPTPKPLGYTHLEEPRRKAKRHSASSQIEICSLVWTAELCQDTPESLCHHHMILLRKKKKDNVAQPLMWWLRKSGVRYDLQMVMQLKHTDVFYELNRVL